MFKFIPATLLFCMAVAYPGTGTPRDLSSDSWPVDRCAAYRGAYCRVPFSIALAKAPLFSGPSIKIQLRGYLIRESEGFALYSDLQSAKLGWRAEAFLIKHSDQSNIQVSLTKFQKKLVSIRGRVLLEASDHDEYWAEFVLEEPVTSAGIRGEKLN